MLKFNQIIGVMWEYKEIVQNFEKLRDFSPYGFFFLPESLFIFPFFSKKKKKIKKGKNVNSSSRKGQRIYQALVVTSISTTLMSWPELENAFNYCKLFWIWKSSLWETYVYYIINPTAFPGSFLHVGWLCQHTIFPDAKPISALSSALHPPRMFL